jgi:hypothetical protein
VQLVADGIAEAPDGTVYVDTGAGDGFNDQVGLYTDTGGVLRPLTIDTSSLDSLPPPGAPGFPATLYPLPRPVRGRDAALPSCPSTEGVVPFTGAARAEAKQLLGSWNTSFSYDLHASDRSWWQGDVDTFTIGPFGGRQTVGPVTPAAGTLYAQAIEAACGSALVRNSLAVVMEPSAYSAAYQHVYLLDRNGTPFVYFGAY